MSAVANRGRVRVTSRDRVLWPRTGFTKGEMIDYYHAISPALLPHLRGRALTLHRFPEGVDGPSWFQANCRGAPSWLAIHEVRGMRGETLRYCVVDDEAGLLWVANLGTIELHPYLALAESPAEPTALVLDLDPGPPAGILAAARVALLARDLLDQVGLPSVVKTSGSLGVHVVVPLAPGHTFAATKAFARGLADRLADARPDLLVRSVSRTRREGRVFVDWVQNDRNRSTVAAYSLRATPWPLVSTPVSWSEVVAAVERGDAAALRFTPGEVLARFADRGDLFAEALARSATLLPRAPSGDQAGGVRGTG